MMTFSFKLCQLKYTFLKILWLVMSSENFKWIGWEKKYTFSKFDVLLNWPHKIRSLDKNRHYNIVFFFSLFWKKKLNFQWEFTPCFKAKSKSLKKNLKKKFKYQYKLPQKKNIQKNLYDFVMMSSAAIFYFYQNFTIL